MTSLSMQQRFGSDSNTDPHDTRQVKQALNRLGYYTPLNKTGITEIPDRAVFDALKQFQKDHTLPADGMIKPGGITENALNEALQKKSTGFYIWRTVKDDRVRSAHAEREGHVFSWEIEPKGGHPGQDYHCRCWAEPVGFNNSVNARKDAILGNGSADFTVLENTHATANTPWYKAGIASQVTKNDRIIMAEAKKRNIDPDLVRAIIYLETTQGYYDILKSWYGGNKTIRPMNIHAEHWKELGYSYQDLQDPEKNIRAGVTLLDKIQDQMPNATIAEIATIYNKLGAHKTTDYGVRVERLYRQKPWRE